MDFRRTFHQSAASIRTDASIDQHVLEYPVGAPPPPRSYIRQLCDSDREWRTRRAGRVTSATVRPECRARVTCAAAAAAAGPPGY